ncbi:MAG: ABC transporter ATP-binding protein [Firmicutes bacterium]|nr:ABC transporter ATP-binding protein [Bacillota bacterium]
MASITLRDLALRYPGAREEAVKGINLVIEDRKFTVFLGPSGCGKTSTLRMIAGFEKPSRGEVWIGDKLVNNVYPGDRDIGMVFQSYALYPHKTIRENLAFCLNARSRRVPKYEIEKRIQDIARMLRLEKYLDQYPRELSAGEQQRAAIGRALIRQPQVLLLDEPLSNLDATLRAEMRTFLRKLQQDLQITSVHVTHDQIEAQAIGDNVVVMDAGVIQQVGSPQEVYRQPRNLFVAGFIGTPAMNFFSGHLEAEGGVTYLVGADYRIPLPPPVAARLIEISAPREVVVGARPEHILIKENGACRSGSESESGAREYGFGSRIAILEHVGNEWVIDIIVGGQVVKVRRDRDFLGFRPAPGRDIWLELPGDKTYVFDKRTTERII